MIQEKNTNCINIPIFALFLSLRYTRAVINTSFTILTVILLLFGHRNPAGVFSLIFYNGLFFSLKSAYQKKKGYEILSFDIPDELKDFLPKKIDLAEQAANQLCLPVSVLIHFLLAFGFLYRMPLTIEQMGYFPLITLSLVLFTRYLSYYALKFYLSKQFKSN